MEETTNESLGTYVKKKRDEKNISIEQVAYATRISLKMLRALEEDDHTALPAPTFVRGYLQAYAKYIRIDTQDLLLRYQHHLATAPDPKKGALRSHYLYVRERYQEKRRLVLVIVLFAAMLSVAGTYFLLKAKRERDKRLALQAEEILKKEPAKPSEASAAKADKTEEKAEEKQDGKENKTESAKAGEPAVKEELKEAKAAPKKEEAKKEEPKAEPKAETKSTATSTASSTAATVAAATAASPSSSDEKKAYNLMLRAEEDVWLRFQTDDDEVRDLTLRSGKGLMLRANKVIKIFSGNLGALKATMNGASLASLTTENRSKSVVLPESEKTNYPLPLFPQFQTSTHSGQNNPQ
jgi:cytoskeletal protein RodZ